MEGAELPNDGMPVNGGSGERPERPTEATFGPAYAILEAIAGDRIPSDPLGADTIAPRVLAIPISLATEILIDHIKHCKHPSRCTFVPAPLWQYRRSRPDAIRNAGEHVNKALWTHADHELVATVRKCILAKYSELSKEISTGSLLNGNRLAEVLTGLGEDGPRILAGVLWASRFNGRGAETLFRMLVPLADNGAPGNGHKGTASNNGKPKSPDRQLRKVTREKKLAEQAAQKAERDVGVKERALQKLRKELEDLQPKYAAAVKDLAALQERLRDTDIAFQILRRDAERTTKANAALRNDLREMQQSRQQLELQRSDLARQIARDRRDVELLRLQLDTSPEGADATWKFIQEEEERIRTHRMTTSGGDKQRADVEWSAHRKLEKAFLEAYPKYIHPPPARIRRKAPLRLVALGGSEEIGRSCYLLELGSHRILVDCGIKPSVAEELHPQLDLLEKPDALILTHAHTDHIGWVPALIQRFGDIDIYCSEGTAALLPVMLDDCRRHYMRRITESRERARFIRNADTIIEEYEDEDVRQVPNLAIKCPFGEQVRLPFGDVAISLFPAGHILGAASVLIEDQSGRRVFFSGDFSSFPQLTVPAATWPEDLGEVDLLVLESTYGGRPHGPHVDSRNQLISLIRETIEEKQGSIILAAFALGRAQELLSLVATARKTGDIPAVPVHIDGMIRQINPIYEKLADNFDMRQDGFFQVGGEADRRDIILEAQRKPAIIVTTSGMMMGGPVVEYAQHLLPDKRHRIVFSGYQDEGAPSNALLELARSTGGPRVVEVPDESGRLVRIEAAVPARHVGLSAHADQPGLIQYASRLRPRVVALVHGDLAAQQKLQPLLQKVHQEAEIICAPSELPVA